MYSVIPANHKCRNCEYQADDRKLRCRWRVSKMSKETYAVADWSSDLETYSTPNRLLVVIAIYDRPRVFGCHDDRKYVESGLLSSDGAKES